MRPLIHSGSAGSGSEDIGSATSNSADKGSADKGSADRGSTDKSSDGKSAGKILVILLQIPDLLLNSDLNPEFESVDP